MDDKARAEAFRALWDAHAEVVYCYALRRAPSSAEDVRTLTFTAAWRKIERLPVGIEARWWLLRVARRQVANVWRSERRRRALYSRLASVPPPPAEDLGNEPVAVSVSLPGIPPTAAPPPVVPETPGVAAPGFDPTRYIGMTLEEAQRRATKDGFSSRVVMLDGEGQMVTADYRSDRLGFTVVDGTVTDVSVG